MPDSESTVRRLKKTMGEGKSEFETKFVCKTIKLVKGDIVLLRTGRGFTK